MKELTTPPLDPESPFTGMLPEDVKADIEASEAQAVRVREELIETERSGNPLTGQQVEQQVLKEVPELVGGDVIVAEDQKVEAQKRKEARLEGRPSRRKPPTRYVSSKDMGPPPHENIENSGKLF
jgi:hypothetical protein